MDPTNFSQEHFDFYKLILNRIKKPTVCDIEAQSVLVRLSSIDTDSFLKKLKPNSGTSDLSSQSSNEQQYIPNTLTREEVLLKCENVNYTLELANETNVFNQVYTGDANEITLKDLKPFTKYFLR